MQKYDKKIKQSGVQCLILKIFLKKQSETLKQIKYKFYF